MDEIDFDKLARVWILVGLACGALALGLLALYYFSHKDSSILADFAPAPRPDVSETPSSNGTHDVVAVEAQAEG